MKGCPFSNKYHYTYRDDGTTYGFYATGIMWDYSEPFNFNSSAHVGFVISRGESELTDEGDYETPPCYEPVENEMIVVRPKLKYPKRG